MTVRSSRLSSRFRSFGRASGELGWLCSGFHRFRGVFSFHSYGRMRRRILDTLVKTPARFTFERDLGDFDNVK